jgi:hypothetical protein
MSKKIELASIAYPPLDIPDAPPKIPSAVYEARITALSQAVDADHIVIYGDREHLANLTFLCGFDPRFEEALLVLSKGKRRLIVGTEGVGYSQNVPIPVDVVRVPTFSLMGIDRSGALTLAEAFAEGGIGKGQHVAIVGWKAFTSQEWSLATPALAVPAFIVDVLRYLVGDEGKISDATLHMMDVQTGIRLQNDVHQLAQFEYGSARSSYNVAQIIKNAKSGVSEMTLMSAITYRGEPFSYHPILTSGTDIPNGLRSATSRIVQLGEAIFTTIGMWGGNCGRGGLVAGSEADYLPENRGYLESFAIPYWETIVAWWETVRVGVIGGDISRQITQMCQERGFNHILGVGHMMDWEDWPNTPFASGSTNVVQSGMIVACDIFSNKNRPQWMAHCEDTVAIADQRLRDQLAELYPDVWQRVTARQAFMREKLNIQVHDDLLPLTVSPAHLTPFWLSPDMALRVK